MTGSGGNGGGDGGCSSRDSGGASRLTLRTSNCSIAQDLGSIGGGQQWCPKGSIHGRKYVCFPATSLPSSKFSYKAQQGDQLKLIMIFWSVEEGQTEEGSNKFSVYRMKHSSQKSRAGASWFCGSPYYQTQQHTLTGWVLWVCLGPGVRSFRGHLVTEAK